MVFVNDHIQKLKAYEPGLQPREDERVIKLNTNENPYPPSPWVLESIRDEASDSLRLYSDSQSRKLRETAASLYGTSPEQVLCGNGSDEILGILLRTFATSGDLIGYYVPSYSYYATLGSIHALQLCPTPLGPHPEQPPLPSKPDLALFFLTNPNSPLGFSLRPETVSELSRHVKGILVVDEAYADFARWNCLSMLRELPNLVITRSLSKSYSLAGLRVGIALAREDLIRQMDKVRDHYNLNRIAQKAASVALRDQKFFQENRKRVLRTRERLFQRLQDLGLDPLPSETNFLFVRFPSPERASSVYQGLLQQDILVRYFEQDGLNNGLRISIGTNRETDRLLDALQGLL
jgi:histidinol-phosphate aminotransferase